MTTARLKDYHSSSIDFDEKLNSAAAAAAAAADRRRIHVAVDDAKFVSPPRRRRLVEFLSLLRRILNLFRVDSTTRGAAAPFIQTSETRLKRFKGHVTHLHTYIDGNWNFRSLILSLPRAPMSESTIGGTFAPWNFRSLELSLPGTGAKVTWNFRSLEHSLPNAKSKTWSFRSPCSNVCF